MYITVNGDIRGKLGKVYLHEDFFSADLTFTTYG